MANQNHLRILQQGSDAWNRWRRRDNPEDIDLREAALAGADLIGANLYYADLTGAELVGADLNRANLEMANLSGANLHGADLFAASLQGANLGGASFNEANLTRANLSRTNLNGANFNEANLRNTNLNEADLSGATLVTASLVGTSLDKANFARVELFQTAFSSVYLGSCIGLESCVHLGHSFIDIETLQFSGQLPLVFLRGIGLPDTLINYLPSLLNQPIQLYSCFISYSAKDEDFARRLHADLQNAGVRCWFAPEDMKIGAKILDTLDEAIRLRDKVLLVLSEASIASAWVEDEVTKTFAEERRRDQVVMFPVRIDDAVFSTTEAWAIKLRDNRNIGDFRRWKDHDAYKQTFARLLRDLRIWVT